jgi:hypothetical protein
MSESLDTELPLLMSVPQSARPDGLGVCGRMLLATGCKLYSRLSDDKSKDNLSTTDLSMVYTVKAKGKGSKVRAPNKRYATQRTRFLNALHRFCTKYNE